MDAEVNFGFPIFLVVVVFLFFIISLFKKSIFPLDYGLYLIFGKKGSGKSCTLASLASRALKKGMCVYSNIPIKGCFLFDPLEFGKFEFEKDCLILVDEVNLIWDNRDFKKFSKYTQALFREQRHCKLTVYMFSQSFDCDKKLRDLADGLFLIRRIGKWFSYVKTVDKDFIITKPTDYGGSDISFGLSIRPWILPSSRQVIFLPKYWHLYDSWSTGDLQLEEAQDHIKFCY